MPVPRFIDTVRGVRYDVSLECECGYNTLKTRITEAWRHCPLCGTELKTRRHDYGPATPQELASAKRGR
jgi:hypothetical protein